MSALPQDQPLEGVDWPKPIEATKSVPRGRSASTVPGVGRVSWSKVNPRRSTHCEACLDLIREGQERLPRQAMWRRTGPDANGAWARMLLCHEHATDLRSYEKAERRAAEDARKVAEHTKRGPAGRPARRGRR